MPAFDFVLAGRYKLQAPLGEGGMASVYRARDLRLNRDVAVKVLHEGLTRDPDFLRRFQREAQIVAALSHPNIVPVYDVGEEAGSHFIVMEYVRGRTVRELIDHAGPLSPERARAIILPILDALGYAHGSGLVHRDVKPQNILLSADGTPRLADFGIAHVADGSATRTAVILGSAHYLSPEQAQGDEPTASSDIYASGIVLYEMLTGHPPFDGQNALAVATQHVNTPPPPLPGSVPGDVRAAVTRALSKNPDHRYADTDQFAAAIAAARVPGSDPDRTAPLYPALVEQFDDEVTEPVPVVASGARSIARATATGIVLRRSARKLVVTACAFALLLAVVAYLISAAGLTSRLPGYPSPAYAAIPALLAVLLSLSWLSTHSWVYSMDADAAVVQWGVISHHRFGVPVRSITTLELKQSPIDRMLGVGTVELSARDQQGRERRLIMHDLPRPRVAYDELMRHLGRAGRAAPRA